MQSTVLSVRLSIVCLQKKGTIDDSKINKKWRVLVLITFCVNI